MGRAAPPRPGELLQSPAYLLGWCPLCWHPLPLSLCGLRERGALRAAERTWQGWTNPSDPPGRASAAVQGTRGAQGVFRCVCVYTRVYVYTCVHSMGVYLGTIDLQIWVCVLDWAHGRVHVFAVCAGDCSGCRLSHEGTVGGQGQPSPLGQGQAKDAHSRGGQARTGPRPQAQLPVSLWRQLGNRGHSQWPGLLAP